MSPYVIVIGNKNYSSWSLRAWLALALTGAPFEEIRIPLSLPDTRRRILAHSPAGKVPVLKADGVTVWETLAIVEWLAERHPEAGLWPEEPAARAVARALAAEMHAGFPDLRRELPMDCRARRPDARWGGAAQGDIDRVVALWQDTRSRFGAGGDFLFGRIGAVDAMFAPVASRLATYPVALPPQAARYRDALLGHPAMQPWLRDAEAEAEVIEFP